MCVWTARAVYALPEENGSMKNTHQPATTVEPNGKATIGGTNRALTERSKAHVAKRKTVATQEKVKVAAPSRKDARRASRQGPGAGTSKLVCRYCGSDDLAPSFIKRRDARCRACFKARYGVAKRKGAKPEPA